MRRLGEQVHVDRQRRRHLRVPHEPAYLKRRYPGRTHGGQLVADPQPAAETATCHVPTSCPQSAHSYTYQR